ncbi:MAG: FAD-dependent oxidoreductase [Ndongobacter sp.]|nr:FAD-dependent oxidoreductase [Ndongobacter sp.]
MKAERIRKKLVSRFPELSSTLSVTADERHIVLLRGEAPDWDTVVAAGHFAAKQRGVRNVRNELSTTEHPIARPDRSEELRAAREQGVLGEYDVVIIGAGVSGCGIARELARKKLRIAVVEKESDVAMGASKANNGMIHPGHAVMPGTLKAKLNIEGNALYDEWAKELHFEFHRSGSVVLAYPGDSRLLLYGLYLVGKLNGVPGIRMMNERAIKEYDPNVPGHPCKGVYTPTTAIVDGFEVTIALAENAAANGVDFFLDTELLAIDRRENCVAAAVTSRGVLKTKCIVDAAGIYADEVAEMAGDAFYTLHARRGVIAILDKNCPGVRESVTRIRPLNRNENSKGGGVERTVSGNPLLGPSAKEIFDREDTSVTEEELEYAFQRGMEMFPGADRSDIISFFAGIRAPDYTEDFIIEASEKTAGFIHCSGIQSPGLASAPAIARRVKGLVEAFFDAQGRPLADNEDFCPNRPEMPRFAQMSEEERDAWIRRDPRAGHVICRCELVTEAEIVEAIRRKPYPRTVDGIKRRVRAGAGRCQGGFCSPRVVDILARELGVDVTEIAQKKAQRTILTGHTRTVRAQEVAHEES